MKKLHRYFLDTEFNEGFRRPYFNLFGKKRHFIDLISIGLVRDDGKGEYYAISKDFDPAECNKWVRENVLQKIVDDYILTFHGDGRNHILSLFSGKTLNGKIRSIQRTIGKSRKEIASDILSFVYAPALWEYGSEAWSSDMCVHAWLEDVEIAFYADYGAYDWVVFCALFGEMIHLPKGFPMYLRDIKQILDEKGINIDELKASQTPRTDDHNALADAKHNRRVFKEIQFTAPVFGRFNI